MKRYRELLERALNLIETMPNLNGSLEMEIKQELARPESSPVAKVISLKSMECTGIITWHPKQNGHLPIDIGQELYTSPPQQKPLSDDVLLEIIDDTFDANDEQIVYHLSEFARAIERAHGIGN
jgi:hypothetical protein